MTIPKRTQEQKRQMDKHYADKVGLIRPMLDRQQLLFDEWIEKCKKEMAEFKAHVDNSEREREYSVYYLIKDELERLFRERESITEEEAKQYIPLDNPENKYAKATSYWDFLLFYRDIYHEDKESNRKLWKKTAEYFNGDFKIYWEDGYVLSDES